MISEIWLGILILSAVFGALTGNMNEVCIAVTEGASNAVTLCISIVGIMSLWCGILEIAQDSGICTNLSQVLSPILRPLFGRAGNDEQAMREVSTNVTANLLGLSNAATPAGLRALRRIHQVCSDGTGLSNEALTLIVLNSSSIQLIPSTVAAVRAATGCVQPFDILPAVWGTSILSASAALISARVLSRFL